eukprot:RCo051405
MGQGYGHTAPHPSELWDDYQLKLYTDLKEKPQNWNIRAKIAELSKKPQYKEDEEALRQRLYERMIMYRVRAPELWLEEVAGEALAAVEVPTADVMREQLEQLRTLLLTLGPQQALEKLRFDARPVNLGKDAEAAFLELDKLIDAQLGISATPSSEENPSALAQQKAALLLKALETDIQAVNEAEPKQKPLKVESVAKEIEAAKASGADLEKIIAEGNPELLPSMVGKRYQGLIQTGEAALAKFSIDESERRALRPLFHAQAALRAHQAAFAGMTMLSELAQLRVESAAAAKHAHHGHDDHGHGHGHGGHHGGPALPMQIKEVDYLLTEKEKTDLAISEMFPPRQSYVQKHGIGKWVKTNITQLGRHPWPKYFEVTDFFGDRRYGDSGLFPRSLAKIRSWTPVEKAVVFCCIPPLISLFVSMYRVRNTSLYSDKIVEKYGYRNPYTKEFREQFDGVNKPKLPKIY